MLKFHRNFLSIQLEIILEPLGGVLFLRNERKCHGIAGEKRGSALLIEKNEPNHPWKISIWDSSSRKQITRRQATSEPLEEGWFVRSTRVIVGSATMVTTSFTIGLIDRNWEDDRGNGAVIRPGKTRAESRNVLARFIPKCRFFLPLSLIFPSFSIF